MCVVRMKVIQRHLKKKGKGETNTHTDLIHSQFKYMHENANYMVLYGTRLTN